MKTEITGIRGHNVLRSFAHDAEHCFKRNTKPEMVKSILTASK